MRKPLNHHRNSLWLARKKAGLGQKSVARLLGHKSASAVSEYETGRLLPNLRTALKLAVIYGTSVSELFAPLCGEVELEVERVRPSRVPSLSCTPQRVLL